jgi:hypothetical protein
MYVIAKMRLTAVEDYGFSRKFKFNCVHDAGINIGDDPENRAFTKATPNGEAWMTVDNKHVWPAFRLPGGSGTDEDPYRSESQHYVLFIDANEHSLADVQRAMEALNG